jgi:muramoyltetrapeptide carboxypeptidase
MKRTKAMLIATSKAISPTALELSAKRIRRIGFHAEWDNSILDTDGYFAGSIERRAREIQEAFSNPDISAVFCITGGYGSIELLDLLDYNIIKNNPKPFVGMSDNTSLLLAINKETGLKLIHGPSYGNRYSYNDKVSMNTLISALGNIPYSLKLSKEQVLRGSDQVVGGELIGGCISLISTLIGTRYSPVTANKILFLEDVRETPQALYNKLMHIRAAGLYNDVRAVIFGKMTSCGAYHNILRNHALSLNVPVIWELEIGHTKRMISLPIGGTAKMDFQNKLIHIE